ncbi:MAG: hypothetical protein ACP5KI_05080 [Brevinematia bacterium]
MRIIFSLFFVLFASFSFGVVNIDRNYIISPFKSSSTDKDFDFLLLLRELLNLVNIYQILILTLIIFGLLKLVFLVSF